MEVLGYHLSDKGLVDSNGDAPKNQSYVEFLLKPKQGVIRVFYDLDYSMPLLLKALKLTEREEEVLRSSTKFHLPPYHLRYIPGRFASIKRASAFSYFSDSRQYRKFPNTDLAMNPLTLAMRAKSTGELVRSILEELGIETTSLTSPARAYEKAQVEFLYQEREKAAGNEVKRCIIDGIGIEVFGRSWEKYLLGR